LIKRGKITKFFVEKLFGSNTVQKLKLGSNFNINNKKTSIKEVMLIIAILFVFPKIHHTALHENCKQNANEKHI
jgi:hypothetical protein